MQHAYNSKLRLEAGVEHEILRDAMQSVVDSVVEDVEAIDEAVQVLRRDAQSRNIAASVLGAPGILWRWLVGKHA